MDAELQQLLDLVDQVLAKRGAAAAAVAEAGQARPASGARPPDAIDLELARPPETTAVVNLRNSQAVEAFHRAVSDAHINADAVRATLLIVHEVLSRAFLAV